MKTRLTMRLDGQIQQVQTQAAHGQGLTEREAELLAVHREIRALLGRPVRPDVWDQILSGRRS